MSIFSFAPARYLDHLCMVSTAWVFPAIQSHTKAPHRDPFRPASRQLYSTHPDNNSQPGAFILRLLCTRNSPYPEPTQVKVQDLHININTHKSCFLISPSWFSLYFWVDTFYSASLTLAITIFQHPGEHQPDDWLFDFSIAEQEKGQRSQKV